MMRMNLALSATANVLVMHAICERIGSNILTMSLSASVTGESLGLLHVYLNRAQSLFTEISIFIYCSILLEHPEIVFEMLHILLCVSRNFVFGFQICLQVEASNQ
jgi:hypothetical protein